MYFTATTQFEFDPGRVGEEAGVILPEQRRPFRSDGDGHEGPSAPVVSRLRFGDVVHESKEVVLKPGPVRLIVKGERATFRFLCAQGTDAPVELAKVEAKYLSSETVGGFTGVYVGFYATGNGKPSVAVADYDWFEYAKDATPPQTGGGRRGGL